MAAGGVGRKDVNSSDGGHRLEKASSRRKQGKSEEGKLFIMTG